MVDACGLVPTGVADVFHAKGQDRTNTYLVNIYLPNNVAFQAVRVLQGVYAGADILIGMDVIARGDFAVTNKGGITKFSYRFPSEIHLDCKAAAEAENRQLVHDYFGLSYASYLVLPRVILEQMDGDWQRRFTECLNELTEAWKTQALPSYKVQRVEGECDRACEACSEEPSPEDRACRCFDGCQHDVPDPLSDYRHPDRELIEGLRSR